MKFRFDRSSVLSIFGVSLTSLLGLIAFDLGAQLGWFDLKAAGDKNLVLAAKSGDRRNIRISAAMRKEYAQRCSVCEATATFASDIVPVLNRMSGRSHFSEVVQYQGDFWEVLRPKLLAGRLPENGGAVGVAVISNSLWRILFLEETFQTPHKVFVDGQPFQIIGVVDAAGDGLFGRTGIWIEKQSLSGDLNTDQIGLVRVSNLEQAQATLQMAAGSMKALGGTSWAATVDGYSLRSASTYLRSKSNLANAPILMELVICASCSFICFTAIVFLLLLVRMRRSVIEWALGASVLRTTFGRVWEQTGIIVAGGGIAGLSFSGVQILSSRSGLPRLDALPGFQPSQTLFVLGILVVGQVCMLIALSALMHRSFGTANKLVDLLRAQGSSGLWKRQQLLAVGMQYFTALLGLVLTVGFIGQLAELRSRDTGLSADGQRLIALRLPQNLEKDPKALVEKTRTLLAALDAAGRPGHAVVTNGLPFLQVNVGTSQVYNLNGLTREISTRIVATTGNYFSQLGVRILAGGVWRNDTSNQIVVNRALADRMGGLSGAVGGEVRLEGSALSRSIVSGVCENTLDAGEDFQSIPTVYVPILALPSTEIAVWSRAADIDSMRWVEELQARDSSFSLYFMKSFKELVEVLSAAEATRVRRFGLMAGIATVSTLFSLGYLIVSALRSNRREYAIMYALGCGPYHLINRLVSRSAGWLAILSIAAVALAKQLSSKFIAADKISAAFPFGQNIAAICTLIVTALLLLVGLVLWTTRDWDRSFPKI